jgi:ATP-dependent DNA helicase RecG
MEVTSPGLLPGPVTIENIKDERFSRHPVIVQVLSDMGFIERLGYGVDRVIELMSKEDLHPPEFNETAGGFRVTLYNQVTKKREIATTQNPITKSKSILHKYQELALNPRQEAAIMHLNTQGNTRITNSELQKLFPDAHAETIRRDLADLVTKEVLSKMGQKRGSFYVMNTEKDD